MPIWLKRLRILVLIVFLLSAGTLIVLKLQSLRSTPASPGNLDHLRLPAFQLVTQDAKPFTNADLRGRVTIVNFIFTNCPFICPMLTDSMQKLSTRLAQTPVRFLSISVDPAHDTPEALTAYAAKNLADTSRWTFASGPADTTRAIITDGFQFELRTDADNRITLKDGTQMSNVVHPPWFALIGPDGHVRSIHLPNVQQDMDDLADAAEREAAKLTTPRK